ncbi:MAG: hydroxyisourate hydrolase [Nocardioidaceae bacterium]
MSAVTTHVLDTASGRPAVGVLVRLERVTDAAPETVGSARTDEEGRVSALGPDQIGAGTYRLVFDTAGYAAAQATTYFFPEVSIAFAVGDSTQHYHVPLLLSPFAYSTYRGS